MKYKRSAFIIASFFFIATNPLMANTIHIAPLKVERTQVVDTQTGNSSVTFAVDGIEIELTEKDKVKARNWNLNHSDWAKYLYIMEYTPRGLWTPDLDPPLALAHASTDIKDIEKYVAIQNAIETHRMKMDYKLDEVTNRLLSVGAFSPQPQLSALQSQLIENKTALRSVFVDLRQCERECRMFVTLTVASTSSSMQLDMHFTGGSQRDAEKLLNDIGITEQEMKRRAIQINATFNNEVVERIRSSRNLSLPFAITKTEEGTTVREM